MGRALDVGSADLIGTRLHYSRVLWPRGGFSASRLSFFPPKMGLALHLPTSLGCGSDREMTGRTEYFHK